MGNWLDDKWWWHKLRGHKVRGPVIGNEDWWYYYEHVCDTCDYSWLK